MVEGILSLYGKGGEHWKNNFMYFYMEHLRGVNIEITMT